MKIDLHILCYNESDIIRLVLEHYKKFCRNMYVYDNHSTDNSREIAKEEGAEVILFGTKFFDDKENYELKNRCWIGSDADWVICCDMDEVLFDSTPHVSKFESGATIFKTIGWQIMSDEWPAQNITDITNGFEFSNYAKNIVFNPKRITDISYGPGAHECNPKGEVIWSTESLYVLHYKHIGGVQRTIDRYREYQKRMSKNNRKNGWGIHYNRTPASIRQEWNERMKISKPLI